MQTMPQKNANSEKIGMIVKRVSVPIGLEELMEGLTKEVLLKKPKDLYMFASEYFSRLVQLREQTNFHNKAYPIRTAQSITQLKPSVQAKEPKPRPKPTRHLSRQMNIRSKSPTLPKINPSEPKRPSNQRSRERVPVEAPKHDRSNRRDSLISNQTPRKRSTPRQPIAVKSESKRNSAKQQQDIKVEIYTKKNDGPLDSDILDASTKVLKRLSGQPVNAKSDKEVFVHDSSKEQDGAKGTESQIIELNEPMDSKPAKESPGSKDDEIVPLSSTDQKSVDETKDSKTSLGSGIESELKIRNLFDENEKADSKNNKTEAIPPHQEKDKADLPKTATIPQNSLLNNKEGVETAEAIESKQPKASNDSKDDKIEAVTTKSVSKDHKSEGSMSSKTSQSSVVDSASSIKDLVDDPEEANSRNEAIFAHQERNARDEEINKPVELEQPKECTGSKNDKTEKGHESVDETNASQGPLVAGEPNIQPVIDSEKTDPKNESILPSEDKQLSNDKAGLQNETTTPHSSFIDNQGHAEMANEIKCLDADAYKKNNAFKSVEHENFVASDGNEASSIILNKEKELQVETVTLRSSPDGASHPEQPKLQNSSEIIRNDNAGSAPSASVPKQSTILQGSLITSEAKDSGFNTPQVSLEPSSASEEPKREETDGAVIRDKADVAPSIDDMKIKADKGSVKNEDIKDDRAVGAERNQKLDDLDRSAEEKENLVEPLAELTDNNGLGKIETKESVPSISKIGDNKSEEAEKGDLKNMKADSLNANTTLHIELDKNESGDDILVVSTQRKDISEKPQKTATKAEVPPKKQFFLENEKLVSEEGAKLETDHIIHTDVSQNPTDRVDPSIKQCLNSFLSSEQQPQPKTIDLEALKKDIQLNLANKDKFIEEPLVQSKKALKEGSKAFSSVKDLLDYDSHKTLMETKHFDTIDKDSSNSTSNNLKLIIVDQDSSEEHERKRSNTEEDLKQINSLEKDDETKTEATGISKEDTFVREETKRRPKIGDIEQVASVIEVVKHLSDPKLTADVGSVREYLNNFLKNEQSQVYHSESKGSLHPESKLDKKKPSKILKYRPERSLSQSSLKTPNSSTEKADTNKMKRARSVGVVKTGETKSRIPTPRRSAGRRPLVRQLEADSKELEEKLNFKGSKDSIETTSEDVLIAKRILEGVEGAKEHIEVIEGQLKDSKGKKESLDKKGRAEKDPGLGDKDAEAATTIQKTWKGYQVRKGLKQKKGDETEEGGELFKTLESDDRGLKEEQAAVKIQSRWRGCVARKMLKKGRVDFKRKNKQEQAVIKLQAIVRGFLERIKYKKTKLRNVESDQVRTGSADTVVEPPVDKKYVSTLGDTPLDTNNNSSKEEAETPLEKDVRSAVDDILNCGTNKALEKTLTPLEAEIGQAVKEIMENNPEGTTREDSKSPYRSVSSQAEEVPLDDQSSVGSMDSVVTVILKPKQPTEESKTPKRLVNKALSTSAIEDHVELLDQVQNSLLDQLSGKPVDDKNKFDIDQLRKELHDATTMYKDEDTSTTMDGYLYDFEPENEEDDARDRIVRTPLRNLPDIAEEAESKEDDGDSSRKSQEKDCAFCGSPKGEGKDKVVDGRALDELVEDVPGVEDKRSSADGQVEDKENVVGSKVPDAEAGRNKRSANKDASLPEALKVENPGLVEPSNSQTNKELITTITKDSQNVTQSSEVPDDDGTNATSLDKSSISSTNNKLKEDDTNSHKLLHSSELHYSVLIPGLNEQILGSQEPSSERIADDGDQAKVLPSRGHLISNAAREPSKEDAIIKAAEKERIMSDELSSAKISESDSNKDKDLNEDITLGSSNKISDKDVLDATAGSKPATYVPEENDAPDSFINTHSNAPSTPSINKETNIIKEEKDHKSISLSTPASQSQGSLQSNDTNEKKVEESVLQHKDKIAINTSDEIAPAVKSNEDTKLLHSSEFHDSIVIPEIVKESHESKELVSVAPGTSDSLDKVSEDKHKEPIKPHLSNKESEVIKKEIEDKTRQDSTKLDSSETIDMQEKGPTGILHSSEFHDGILIPKMTQQLVTKEPNRSKEVVGSNGERTNDRNNIDRKDSSSKGTKESVKSVGTEDNAKLIKEKIDDASQDIKMSNNQTLNIKQLSDTKHKNAESANKEGAWIEEVLVNKETDNSKHDSEIINKNTVNLKDKDVEPNSIISKISMEASNKISIEQNHEIIKQVINKDLIESNDNDRQKLNHSSKLHDHIALTKQVLTNTKPSDIENIKDANKIEKTSSKIDNDVESNRDHPKLLHSSEFHDTVLLPELTQQLLATDKASDIKESIKDVHKGTTSNEAATDKTITNPLQISLESNNQYSKLLHSSEFHDTVLLPNMTEQLLATDKASDSKESIKHGTDEVSHKPSDKLNSQGFNHNSNELQETVMNRPLKTDKQESTTNVTDKIVDSSSNKVVTHPSETKNEAIVAKNKTLHSGEFHDAVLNSNLIKQLSTPNEFDSKEPLLQIDTLEALKPRASNEEQSKLLHSGEMHDAALPPSLIQQLSSTDQVSDIKKPTLETSSSKNINEASLEENKPKLSAATKIVNLESAAPKLLHSGGEMHNTVLASSLVSTPDQASNTKESMSKAPNKQNDDASLKITKLADATTTALLETTVFNQDSKLLHSGELHDTVLAPRLTQQLASADQTSSKKETISEASLSKKIVDSSLKINSMKLSDATERGNLDTAASKLLHSGEMHDTVLPPSLIQQLSIPDQASGTKAPTSEALSSEKFKEASLSDEIPKQDSKLLDSGELHDTVLLPSLTQPLSESSHSLGDRTKKPSNEIIISNDKIEATKELLHSSDLQPASFNQLNDSLVVPLAQGAEVKISNASRGHGEELQDAGQVYVIIQVLRPS